MAEKECKVNGMSSQKEANLKSQEKRAKRQKNRIKKRLQEFVKAVEEVDIEGPPEEVNSESSDIKVESKERKRKKKIVRESSLNEEASRKSDVEQAKIGKKKRKQLLQETPKGDEAEVDRGGSPEELNLRAESDEREEEKLLKETAKGDKEQAVSGVNPLEDGVPQSNDKITKFLKNKKKVQLLKETAKVNKPGVCYLSRIPPHMDHVQLRHILSQYGEILRIYLAPEDPTTEVPRKRAGRFQAQEFSEGWVEFANNNVAKRVANMLNGEQIGGRKRSQFYFDILNIKYLSKFKWDDLTEEIAHKHAVREQKLALELSAAKRERDFYLAKVDQSLALSSIQERLKKKRKVQQAPKVIRQFPQREPVAVKAEQSKPKLPQDVLAEVFGGSL